MKPLTKSFPASVVGYIVLTLILTAGAAQSLSGTNTVDTDDIIDGAVTTSDIRANAVTSSRIITGGVFGTDVADNSLKGVDIDESTLALPVTAPSGSRFFGHYRFHGGDSGSSAGTGAGASISLPVPFATAPTSRVIEVGGTGTADCLGGTISNPRAAPGFICLYKEVQVNTITLGVTTPTVHGVDVATASTGAGPVTMAGRWAATAP
jgi:hypothetical protein